MPTYNGNNYLLSQMLNNLANLDTPLSGVKSGTDQLSTIATDTGNLPTILTHAQNTDNGINSATQGLPALKGDTTNLANIKTSAANLDTPLSGVKGGTDNIATVASNTNATGAGLNTQNINNKLLTAQKTSQVMGFLGGSGIVSNFTTSSTTYVSTGISVANVPNNASIVWNIWSSGQGNGGGNAGTINIVSGSTSEATQNIISTLSQYKNYSGTVKNTSGITTTVQVQCKSSGAWNITIEGITPNISSMICYNGSNVIISLSQSIINGLILIGACQVDAIGIGVMSSSTWNTATILNAGVSTPTNNTDEITLPSKIAFPNGIPIGINSTIWNDVDLFLIIDFTGDILTVN